MGADSGNLKIQDSQSNTSIIEPGLKDGIIGAGLNATVYANTSVALALYKACRTSCMGDSKQ